MAEVTTNVAPTADTTVTPTVGLAPAPSADLDAVLRATEVKPTPVVTTPIPEVVTPEVVTPEVVTPEVKAPLIVDTTGMTFVQATATQFLAARGLSEAALETALVNVTKHKDVSLVDTSVLGVNAKPEDIAEFKRIAQAAYTEQTEAVQRNVDAAYAIAGGKANLDAAVTAFNTTAPKDIKSIANALINSGNYEQATRYILEFARSNGIVGTSTGNVVQGGTTAPTQGISKAQYTQEIGKVMREAGNRSIASGVYAERIAALDAQRAIGAKQGL